MKIKNAVSKNQMTFLQQCIYHNITPKSFRLKTPIKSKKAFNIMNVYKKKLIVIDKNNAKEKMHNAVLKVNELCQTLKAKVSEEHYLLIQSATEKSRENEFVKKKEHLMCKIDLTYIALTSHQTSLLNLGPKFVPTEKRKHFMEIITAAEPVALNLEYHNKEVDIESLRQSVCQILNKNRNIKIKDNFQKEQRKALKEIRPVNNNTKVYPKGSEFVVLSEEDAMRKIEKQLGKAKVIDEDPKHKSTQ